MPSDDYREGYSQGYSDGYRHALESPSARERTRKGNVRKTARRAYEKPKVKRKASAYNKRYATAYKRLKKKHPRTSFAALAKKAHKEARRK